MANVHMTGLRKSFGSVPVLHGIDLSNEPDPRRGDFAAVAILSGLPITVVFMLAQKWMVAGLTAGGIKG